MLERVNITETPFVNPLTRDYLKRDAFLKDFYTCSHELNNYAELFSLKSNFPKERRLKLSKELLKQYTDAGINLKQDSKVLQNILELEKEQTFTVTTGHQLVMFGGPLFTAYKIMSTIKLAAELNHSYPDKKVVPVFWLASEDHDYEEIKHTYINGETLTWNAKHDGQAVGSLVLTEIEKLISELESLLPDSGLKNKHLQYIRDAYQNGFTLSKATLKYFHSVFQDWGLVIIEPSNIEFKKEIQSLMYSDIIEQNSFKAQLNSDRILSSRYELQIGAREINFFYFDDVGKRLLIKKTAKGFGLSDQSKSFTIDEMKNLILHQPDRLSPNVNLRPLYQETLLPNLAYIGGPAELAYWLQLKSIFDANSLAFPIVVLRMMHLFTPPGLDSRMARFGLQAKHALQKPEALSDLYFQVVGDSSIESQINQILQNWQEIYELSAKVNDAFHAEILAQKLKDKAELKSLNKIYKEKRLLKHQAKLEKLLKLRAELYPAGILQERIETLMWYECLMDKSLSTELYEVLRVFESEMILQ
ncbi:MAG: bacillithiol biosynthesis cysteine-adding enzyme BshC [Bacteroidia bacterium]